MKVIARAGVRVPAEINPRSYISDAGAVEVEDSHYYRRRLRDGDLILVLENPVVAGVVKELSHVD